MSAGTGNAQSPSRRRAPAEASSPQRAPAPASPPSIDDETAAALTLYNAYLVADREQQAHERALKKAERAKDDAAAAVRKLNEGKAPAAETAAAEAKYREAAEALQRLRDGDAATPEGDYDKSDDETDDTEQEAQANDTAETDDTEQEAQANDTAETDDTEQEAQADDTAETADGGDTGDTAETEDTGDEAPGAEAQAEAPVGDGGDDGVEDPESVGVEASVGDDDLACDEPAGVAG